MLTCGLSAVLIRPMAHLRRDAGICVHSGPGLPRPILPGTHLVLLASGARETPAQHVSLWENQFPRH